VRHEHALHHVAVLHLADGLAQPAEQLLRRCDHGGALPGHDRRQRGELRCADVVDGPQLEHLVGIDGRARLHLVFR